MLAPAYDWIAPDELNGRVWASLVKNAVTASCPSAPSEPGWIPNNVKLSAATDVPPLDWVNTFTAYVFGVLAVGFSNVVFTLNVLVSLLLPWRVPSLRNS